jgi:hypothetical protein
MSKGRRPMAPSPTMSAIDSYPIGLAWPHSLRRPLESAAADGGQSVAGFIEATLLSALIAAGLIERPRAAREDLEIRKL